MIWFRILSRLALPRANFQWVIPPPLCLHSPFHQRSQWEKKGGGGNCVWPRSGITHGIPPPPPRNHTIPGCHIRKWFFSCWVLPVNLEASRLHYCETKWKQLLLLISIHFWKHKFRIFPQVLLWCSLSNSSGWLESLVCNSWSFSVLCMHLSATQLLSSLLHSTEQVAWVDLWTVERWFLECLACTGSERF